jgi:hypothetical protein
MKRQKNLWIETLVGACGVALAGLSMLAPNPALAQSSQAAPKATGELVLTRQATVDGQPGVAGVTVFGGSRIKTAKQGAASVSLGRQGRIELGSDTEMALRLTSGAVGGELTKGRLLINVPPGVKLSINTGAADSGRGLVITDGAQATILSVEAVADNLSVVARRGAAIVAAGGKTERVTAGEEIAINTARAARSGDWRRRAVSAGGAGSAVAGAVAGSSGPAGVAGVAGATGAISYATPPAAAAQGASFSSLVNAGVNYSITRLTRSRDPEQFFSTTVTCKDHDSILCQRRSGVTP